jgi:hypothetical protein
VRDPPRSTKVGTKFRRQVAVAQSVYFCLQTKGHGGSFFNSSKCIYAFRETNPGRPTAASVQMSVL